jgi:Fe2+ transport system protein B
MSSGAPETNSSPPKLRAAKPHVNPKISAPKDEANNAEKGKTKVMSSGAPDTKSTISPPKNKSVPKPQLNKPNSNSTKEEIDEYEKEKEKRAREASEAYKKRLQDEELRREQEEIKARQRDNEEKERLLKFKKEQEEMLEKVRSERSQNGSTSAKKQKKGKNKKWEEKEAERLTHLDAPNLTPIYYNTNETQENDVDKIPNELTTGFFLSIIYLIYCLICLISTSYIVIGDKQIANSFLFSLSALGIHGIYISLKNIIARRNITVCLY